MHRYHGKVMMQQIEQSYAKMLQNENTVPNCYWFWMTENLCLMLFLSYVHTKISSFFVKH
jgi:hypothetical protein